MYTEAELNDEFGPVDADECAEMRSASKLGHSTEELSTYFDVEEATVRHHLGGRCSHC